MNNISNQLKHFAETELVLVRSETERASIQRSLEHLEKVIRNRLGNQITEILRFGSYTRGTILPRKYDSLSDVDLMIVFDKVNWDRNHGTYRKWLLEEIGNSYPNSYVQKSFPTVRLELNHIMFDLVPAYVQGSYYKTYHIPASGDRWRTTAPNDINETLERKKRDYPDSLVLNTIRLCKHWNASWNYPYESYLLEKEVLNSSYYYLDDLFEAFIRVLGSVARTHNGAIQAINYIKQYKGRSWQQPDFQKRNQWLIKLLPGFNPI